MKEPGGWAVKEMIDSIILAEVKKKQIEAKQSPIQIKIVMIAWSNI